MGRFTFALLAVAAAVSVNALVPRWDHEYYRNETRSAVDRRVAMMLANPSQRLTGGNHHPNPQANYSGGHHQTRNYQNSATGYGAYQGPRNLCRKSYFDGKNHGKGHPNRKSYSNGNSGYG